MEPRIQNVIGFWILLLSLAILLCSSFFPRSKQSFAGLIIEYENFAHDLPQTVKSMNSLVTTMAIYHERFLYPPLSTETSQKFQQLFQKFRFFEMKRSLRESSSSLNLESFFSDSDYLLVFSDGSRPVRDIEDSLREIASKMSKDNVDVVIFPVMNWKCPNPQKCQYSSNVLCNPFSFQMEHWTLRYLPESQITNNCDYSNDNDFVIMVQRSKFFSLPRPLLRPFTKSFLLQASLLNLKVQLETEPLFFSEKIALEGRKKEKKRALEEYRKLKLYQELGIKRIQKSVPEEPDEWYGCSRETPRCFGTIHNDQPDFLFQDRLLPPCCRRNLELTGRYVLKLLSKVGIRHWLEGGSLLGAARNGEIIPWDFDIDIGFYREDIDRLGESIKTLLEKSDPGTSIEDSNGFLWEKATEGDFLRVHYSRQNRIHVDLFPFYPKDTTDVDNMTMSIMTKDTWFPDHPQDCEFPESFLEPLTTIAFIGINASAPANVKEFLEYKFGEGVIEKPKMPGSFRLEDFRLV